MIRLGLDFDNTLITYDSLFHKIALSQGLIPDTIKKNKTSIRNFLRENGQEEKFTLLQGEVYGARINEADQAVGMLSALGNLSIYNIELFIVSHKTKIPYIGPKYDLHNSAEKWLERNEFFSQEGLAISRNNVYFELTKEEKIKRISTLNCTHYIDDLPEILEIINSNTQKILYDPLNTHEKLNKFIKLKDWKDLNEVLDIY
tara:strand:+ start:3783 stop:4388 length:606 start_codon:yes stop_codon:yes gene_type:complete